MEQEVDVAYARIMLLGAAGVGKSSFVRGLKKLPFNQEVDSTLVADVRPISYNWTTGDWRDANDQDELDEMAQLLANVYHNEQSAHKLVSTVTSVKTLYGNTSMVSSESTDQVLEEAKTTKVESYLKNAITRAKQLLPNNIRELKPSPFLHVWDCGGQPIFLEVLPAFLTPRTMFLLLFDASKDFESTWKSIQFQQGRKIPGEEVNMTIFELLDKWMATIHSHLARKTREGDLLDYPRILGIGTHGDKLLHEDKKQSVIDRFNTLYSDKAFAELFDDILVVDNTTAGSEGSGEDPGFGRVRESIHKFALEKLVVKTPVSWVLFRKILHMFAKESKNVITYNEAKAIGVACKISTEDIHKVLMFYHDLGVILYYSHIRGLKDKVILSPKWFVESLGKVLALEGTETYQTKKMWRLLREKGILIQPLYVAIWKKCGGLDPEGMIELLVSFHLAACVETEEYYDRKAPQYFVPCVLQLFTGDPPLSTGDSLRATPLHITFSTKFVPPGYFTRFVATVAGFKACQLHFKNGIYRNLVSFQFGDGKKYDHITFTELPHAIQINISRNVPDSQEYTSFSQACQDLLIVLDDSCKEVDKCFRQNTISCDAKSTDIHRKFQFLCESFECNSSDDALFHYLIDTEEGQMQNDPCKCDKVGVFRKLTEEEAYWFPAVREGVKVIKHIHYPVYFPFIYYIMSSLHSEKTYLTTRDVADIT